MNYEPDWTNSRTKKPLLKRLVTVLEWCKFTLDDQSYTPVHTSRLKEIFGSQSNPFSSWLMEKLLIGSISYAPGKYSKGYQLNRNGYNELKALIPDDSKHNQDYFQGIEKNPLVQKYKAELETLEFKYRESSDRLWHPLQNIKREMKPEFWAPYLPYDYDVEACAPTLILQLARNAGMSLSIAPAIDEYLEDKSKLRNRVMELSGLSYSDSKRLINSLFNGAKLIPHFECSAFRLLGSDAAKLHRVKDDKEVTRLRNSVLRCWEFIRLSKKMAKLPKMSEILNPESKKMDLSRATREELKTGADKWEIYFMFEREVLNVVIDELTKQGIKFFTEHDGFRTNVPIDVDELTAKIKSQTGFELKLSGPTSQSKS